MQAFHIVCHDCELEEIQDDEGDAAWIRDHHDQATGHDVEYNEV